MSRRVPLQIQISSLNGAMCVEFRGSVGRPPNVRFREFSLTLLRLECAENRRGTYKAFSKPDFLACKRKSELITR